ncbi:hypothetical protein Val02_22060 [Virgisporangium aliadipatigenens]|uniref:Uncharacterized protein n=1 Tax=Virgisporangium aliadipatigenens TaxID=741659 RepID=A0A8J3YJT1_9ACTN|nr:hypothetical protein [Virgisporangium aliadipatigenens]GIJ45320.1 hypothetical protein Val02_22060 [Virgisporangium aliadipatigenens]
MAGLLPQLSLEPAPGYKRFVERHFEALRRDARRLTGDELDADAVYGEVLTDVALRWQWFELLRRIPHRADPAERFVGVALARRVARRRVEVPAETSREIRFEVTPVPSDGPVDTITTWPSAGWYPEAFVIDPAPPTRTAAPAPAATSAAVRIAAVRPLPPSGPSPGLDAVIAWLNAYSTWVRCRRIAAAAVIAVVAVVLIRLRGLGA